MEEDVEYATISGFCERRPPTMAAAGTRNRPTAGHLGVEQMQGSKGKITMINTHMGNGGGTRPVFFIFADSGGPSGENG